MKYKVIITCNKSKTLYDYVNGFYAESTRSSTFSIWALCWYGKSCIGTALLLCVVEEMFSRALVIHHCIWSQILTENNVPTQVNDIHVHVYVFVMAWNVMYFYVGHMQCFVHMLNYIHQPGPLCSHQGHISNIEFLYWSDMLHYNIKPSWKWITVSTQPA